MFWDKKGRRYTKDPLRLTDVISLISVLALDFPEFRTELDLHQALRSYPRSTEKWKDIANDHPEFFRPNGAQDHFALVIRSYFPIGEYVENTIIERRRALTFDETQKLINVTIELHRKEIERIQRNSHQIPLFVAIIALFGVIYTSYQTHQGNSNIRQSLDSVKHVLSNVRLQIDRIKLTIQPIDSATNKALVNKNLKHNQKENNSLLRKRAVRL